MKSINEENNTCRMIGCSWFNIELNHPDIWNLLYLRLLGRLFRFAVYYLSPLIMVGSLFL